MSQPAPSPESRPTPPPAAEAAQKEGVKTPVAKAETVIQPKPLEAFFAKLFKKTANNNTKNPEPVLEKLGQDNYEKAFGEIPHESIKNAFKDPTHTGDSKADSKKEGKIINFNQATADRAKVNALDEPGADANIRQEMAKRAATPAEQPAVEAPAQPAAEEQTTDTAKPPEAAPAASAEAQEPPKAPETKEPLSLEQQALVDAGKIGAELGKIGLDDESFKKAADALSAYADDPAALRNIQTGLEALKDPEAAKKFAEALAKEGTGSAAGATEASAASSTPEADSTTKSPEQIKKEEQIKTMAEIGKTIAEEDPAKQNEILDHIARNPDTTQESLKLLKTIKSGDNEAVASMRQDYEDRLKALEDKINGPEKDQPEEQKKEEEEKIGIFKALLAIIGITAIGLVSATGELSRAK